jgi:Transposase IS4
MQSNIQRELIDCSQLGGSAAVSQDEVSILGGFHTDGSGFGQISQESQEVTLLPMPPLPPSPLERRQEEQQSKKKTRSRPGFSKLDLYAGRNLFLNPRYERQFLEKFDPELKIVGKIVACPTKKNNNEYNISWQYAKENLEKDWIQFTVANNPDNKKLLLDAGVQYKSINPSKNSNSHTTTRKKRTSGAQQEFATPEANGGPPPTTGPNGTPPAIIRAAAAAALGTASAYSNFSSLSGSGNTARSQLSQRTTRSNDDALESDTDDGEDLDEHDNAYQVLPPGVLVEDLEENNQETNPEDLEQNNSNMGEIGVALANLQWKFQPAEEGKDPFEIPDMSTEETGLKEGVADLFTDPFTAMKVLGGFDYAFVSRLTRNSNEYAKRYILPKYPRNAVIHGEKWRSIKTAEMYQFLGIMLKISLSPVDAGGYVAYFSKSNLTIRYNSVEDPINVTDSKGFAQEYMSLGRFKQIRMAYHPEDKSRGDGGDKCYQIRHALNTVNAAAMACFIIGAHLTFDEGGVACRSRFCPVRMYNSQKPDKFRVDLFILACSVSYVIFNVDVYQGKNASNVGIDPSIIDLPTTQKAPMNAVLKCQLHLETDGARHLALDNRYQCAQLAVGLRERANILSTGTVRSNRKGWDRQQMNLKKTDERGSSIVLVDEVNKLVAAQWVDSKVVNCISTINDTSIGKVSRQRGSVRAEFDCPNIIKKYQQTMFGVDKGDQLRMHGGGFSRKAHFKKWYKKIHLGILDIMLMNSYIGWNMATKATGSNKYALRRWEFYTAIAERMLHFREATPSATHASLAFTATQQFVEGEVHQPFQKSNLPRGTACMVCKLETNAMGVKKDGMSRNISVCGTCSLVAHAFVPENVDGINRLIHQQPECQGKSCWQIAHEQLASSEESGKKGIWCRKTAANGVGYSVNVSHPIVIRLRQLHGLSGNKKRRRNTIGNNEQEDSGNEED